MTESLRRSFETANDRYKRSFGRVFWASLIVAAVAHFALFQLFPTLEAEDWTKPAPPVIREIPLPEIHVPPPPEEIRAPQIPVPSSDLEITDVPDVTTLTPGEIGPPPPSEDPNDVGTGFSGVYTVRPELKDPARARRIVEDAYPRAVKDAGLGGTVLVRARVDTLGRVVDAVLVKSSGLTGLDEAALSAIRRFEFTPALNRDTKVEVWVQQKITFQSR